MKVTLIIWISAIILQEVEPGTIARIPRDVANLKSSIHTQYEANYKQKGKHGNDSFSTIKGNQEILHENCNDTWNEFAEKCAGLVKDLIASLANTISSSPGDATNLQLHIKNNFTHIDTSHKRNCFKRPPTCLSNLNISSLFNNETGNILNKPNADAPITVLTTLKKSDSCDESNPTPIQPNHEDVILDSSSEVPKRSQQGSSLDYGNGAHMNPEEAEALTGPEINNNRRQVKYPTSELVESENTVFRPEDSTTDPSTSSRLPVVPLNAETLSSNSEPHVAFDPNDMSLEISAVPSNPPFNIRNTSPNPYSVNGLDNSGNSYLDPSLSTENMSSRGPKARGVAGQPYSSSESSNEFFPNLIDRKNSISPKYTSQEVSSEENKYHTYLPPQSLIGEPLNGDSQPLREDFESEEKPNHNLRGHVLHEENDLLPEKMPRPAAHHHHPPLSKMENEEPPLPHIPHHPFITPTATPPVLLNPALPPSEHSQSKEPSSPLLLADHTPDLSKTNVPHHSISHQDPLQELKPHASHHPHPIENQPIITDDSTPPIIVPVSEPKKTQPEILPTQISNVEPPAKEVSHDDYSNGNQPALPLESIPRPVSTEPQILSFPQSSGKPLEASNHLSHHNTEPAAPVGELVLSEESPSYGSPENESLDDKPAPPPLLVESITHFEKPSSSVEDPEVTPAHDPHKTHQHSHHHPHPHPHALPYPPPHHHPHHHPGSTMPADEDDVDKKPLPEVKHIPIIESEEKPSSPKRELTHPHPSHPKIDSDPITVSEKELPPSPPPKVELVPISLPEKELPPPKTEIVPVPPVEKELPPSPPPKMELVPVSLPEKELPPPSPPKVELVPAPVVEKALPPPPKEKELPPPKIELVPVPVIEKELPPPPPPPKMELVPVPPVEKELPPPPPPKMELVPVSLPEKELPPPSPPKIELVPVPVVEKALPLPPPPKEKELPPPKMELVPVPVIDKELPPPPSSPHLKEKELPPPKMELVPVPVIEKELPPPPQPPKMELIPVFPSEKELPPPPPPPPPKVELVPVPVIEKELPPPPPPPPPHHSKEKELPPPKMQLVPDFPSEKELPPPPPPKVELVPVIEKEVPPPKMELVPVYLPEKEVVVPEKEFPPPPPKDELVPVLPLEKELPPPPPPSPPKVELVPVIEKEVPPPKMELVPVSLPEKELPPPPPKAELVPVLPQEKELPPPPPKVELVPISLPEKELPPPPPPPPKVELVPVGEKDPPPPKMELVPVLPPEKELPPPPPPPKMELVPVSLPEKELPPPPKPELALVPATEEELPPKVKVVPFPSSEQNEIPGHDSKEEKPFADMPWPPHAPHPSHHHHPEHPERPDHPAPHHPHPPPPPPPPHHHHPHHPPHHPHHPHHPHKKEEHEDDSSSYSKELQALEEEKELENEKATTFQTTAADPTPPETTLSYPPFFMPNPTSQAPPPLTIPNSEGFSLTPSATTFKTVPTSKPDDDDDEDDYEDCCSCESCREGNESGVKGPRTSACQDLEQARRELKAIFDKIKKKLKCGRKTQRPAITT